MNRSIVYNFENKLLDFVAAKEPLLEMLQWMMDKFMEIEVARKTGQPQDFKHEHPWTAQPWNSKALLCCRHFPLNGFLYKTDNKLSAWVFRWLADWALLYECRFNKTSKGDSVWRSMMDLRLFSGTKLRTKLDTIKIMLENMGLVKKLFILIPFDTVMQKTFLKNTVILLYLLI